MTTRWRIMAALGAAVLLSVGVGKSWGSSVAAFSPIDGTFNNTSFNSVGNDGLYFTVGNSPISVTALGYFRDGYVHSDEVGIFLVSSGTPVAGADTTVTTTSGVLPIPSFDYAAITPVTLAANTSYVLVGAINSSVYAQYTTPSDAAHVVPSAGITYDGYQYNYSPSFSLPNSGAYTPAYIGPNFQFAVVPLPASVGVGFSMLFGFGAMFAFRKQLSRRPRIA